MRSFRRTQMQETQLDWFVIHTHALGASAVRPAPGL